MTTPRVKTKTNPAQRAAKSVQRAAFTLVELMIVIVIIGILAGIATPFIYSALVRAKEFTVENEMQQLNAAVERFRTDNGFYPPAIGPGLEIDTTNPTVAVPTFRRYLNRIAPNHAEGSGAGNDGLSVWWTTVGCKLDASSSLVFWLSGLCTSKQYPLSGSAALVGTPLAPYNASLLSDDTTSIKPAIDRQIFFEFNQGQLVNAPSATAIPAGIKAYNQPNGKGNNLAYQYRDSKSYMSGIPAYYVGDPTVPESYFNPTSFQIVGPGMDGLLSNQEMPNTNLIDESGVDPAQDDNITNFSSGRLEKSYP